MINEKFFETFIDGKCANDPFVENERVAREALAYFLSGDYDKSQVTLNSHKDNWLKEYQKCLKEDKKYVKRDHPRTNQLMNFLSGLNLYKKKQYIEAAHFFNGIYESSDLEKAVIWRVFRDVCLCSAEKDITFLENDKLK